MKVLQINSVCGVGSTGRIATDIAGKLIENNMESYIAYGRDSSIENDSIIKIGSEIDYYVHGLLTRLFDTHALVGSRSSTLSFIEKIKEIDPDVIHLHNLHGYYINIKILFDYLETAAKPVVWTLHDCWSFTGHCAHFSYAQCEKWVGECYKCSERNSYPASAFLDNSQRNYRIKKKLFTNLKNMTIVTPSHWLADLVGRSFLSKYPVQVIPNGIDTDIFKPVDGEYIRKKLKLGNKFVILGVSNIWDDKKGLSHFMQLSEMLDDDCIIILVGLNEKQIKKLPPKILGIKRTADINELAQFYSVADVFVNLTLEDTFPTVNLEALACGTPVITFKTGGSPEAIDANSGYVVEISNINGVKESINIVKNNGKEYYSEKGITRVREYFNKNDRFEEYINLYKSVARK